MPVSRLGATDIKNRQPGATPITLASNSRTKGGGTGDELRPGGPDGNNADNLIGGQGNTMAEIRLNGDSTGGANNNGSHALGTRTRIRGRRRALIEDSSEEDEGEKDNHQASHPALIKGKALTFHDIGIGMQLEDVSPEHGGSSLQLSLSNHEFMAAPNKATALRIDTINLAERTPTTTSHKSPRSATTSDNHSAKRRRSESGGLTAKPDSHISQNTKTKEAIPSIDIVSQMWLGFPIHEAVASQKGVDIVQEHRTNKDFGRIGTPPREITDFKTLRRAFPRVPQLFYPNERPDAVPGNHLHFTQIPRQEKVDPLTGLSEGFHITIRFDYGFKSISRQKVRGDCLERLKQMSIPLGTAYSNPIDIGINVVTKNWAGFIKVHLQHPQRDGHALLQGNRAFVLEMKDGESVIGKVEKRYELVTKACNLRLHLKGEMLRHEHAFNTFEAIVRENYYTGKQHEFMGLTKPEFDKNFAFLTLTKEETRDLILKDGLTFNHERLQVSITRDRGTGNPSELRIAPH